MMLAVASENRLQFVPNWKGMMMPDTTPIAKEIEKIFVQKLDMRRYVSRRVAKYKPSMKATKEASPTVKAGSKMCQAMTHTNCSRERSKASCVIGRPSLDCRRPNRRYHSAPTSQHP